MALPLWGDLAISNAAGSMRTFLNGSVELRLFNNVFAPTPGSPGAAFHECVFGGYAPIAVTGLWPAPAFVIDGRYQIILPTQTWTCTGAPSDQIAGWYLTLGTLVKRLIACEAFDTPIAVMPGTQYSLQLRPQFISRSIL